MRIQNTRLSERFRLSTFAKYFLSYVLVLLLLFSGSLLISQSQTNHFFTDASYNAAQEKTSITFETFHNVISAFSSTNEQLIWATQNELNDATVPEWRDYRILTLITNYESTNHMLDAIIYYNEEHDRVLSTKYFAQKVDGGLSIQRFGHDEIFFLPMSEPVRDSLSDELILLADGDSRLLVFKTTTSGHPYQFFYIFDTAAVQALFRGAMGDMIDAYALLDNRTGTFIGTEPELLAHLLEEHVPQDSVFTEHDGYSIYSLAGISKHFTLTAVMSNAKIASQVRDMFINTFLLMLLLGGVCTILVFLAMRLTYWPLKRLLFQLSPAAQLDKSYVAQLAETFQQAQQQSTALLAKYDSYRINIQKTLLAPVLTQHIGTDMQFSYPDIDLLFTQPAGTRFYLLYCHHPMSKINSSTPYAIQNFVEERLHGQVLPILLASSADTSILILCLTGATETSDSSLESLLLDMHRQMNVRITLSDASLSPLDVPVLYDHMMSAVEKLDHSPVVVYTPIDSQDDSLSVNYPSTLFMQLAESLEAQSYPAAHNILDEILRMLKGTDTSQQDYFARFVLVDLLSSIINCMVTHQVSTDAYYTAYAEALFLCRTCSYDKDSAKISHTLHELLKCCEASIRGKRISKVKLDEAMQQNYSNPDFSITMLAELFQSNPSYMSVLFDKLCGMTFTDYLWKIRLEKFEELSRTTDMTIENLSHAIGYEYIGSFRRKFKAETGMTPSEYRSQLRKQSDTV